MYYHDLIAAKDDIEHDRAPIKVCYEHKSNIKFNLNKVQLKCESVAWILWQGHPSKDEMKPDSPKIYSYNNYRWHASSNDKTGVQIFRLGMVSLLGPFIPNMLCLYRV